MPLLASYIAREGFFHRLDPRTKLTWLAVALVACFAVDRIAVHLALIALVFGSSRLAKLDLTGFLPITRVFCALAVGMIVVQTVFSDGGELFYRLGPVALHSQGPYLAVRGTVRLYGTVLLFLQFTMWTHPNELSQAMVRAGLPYRYAMLVGLALRFFPVLEGELRNILEAQEARGMELRSPLRKALAMVPVSLPLCLRTLRRANEVSLAMELRGYGFRPHRTFLRTIAYRPADYAITAVLTISLIACLGARLLYPIDSLWW
jgi:energy-coupling factor transport system permease protein